jgi:hypothetical protein
VATRGDGYALVYSPQGRKFTVKPDGIGAKELKAWWYNPRTGTAADAGTFPGAGSKEFSCPAEGFGADWVLVLDDAARKFSAPGRRQP